MIGILHTSFKLQHGPGNFDTPDVGKTVGDFTYDCQVCGTGNPHFFAGSPSVEALKVARQMKEEQAKAKTCGDIDIDGLTMIYGHVFFDLPERRWRKALCLVPLLHHLISLAFSPGLRPSSRG